MFRFAIHFLLIFALLGGDLAVWTHRLECSHCRKPTQVNAVQGHSAQESIDRESTHHTGCCSQHQCTKKAKQSDSSLSGTWSSSHNRSFKGSSVEDSISISHDNGNRTSDNSTCDGATHSEEDCLLCQAKFSWRLDTTFYVSESIDRDKHCDALVAFYLPPSATLPFDMASPLRGPPASL